LAEAWSALDWTQREQSLLGSAALLVIARSAGASTRTGGETLQPCQQETLPVCNDPAAESLRRMLSGDNAACLPEWLELAAAAGQLCPPRDLPALLSKAQSEASLRPLITHVLGHRGLWLARQHQPWHFVLASAAVRDDAWDTGTPQERLAWLRHMQATDPARAASALIAVWPQESGDTREAFLEVLHQNPHASLGPLLEKQALKDRRSAVRGLAWAALMRLPETEFAQRSRKRAAPLLKLEGMLMMKRLTLALPESFDPLWKEDGIEEKPPAGMGRRAWWARQILAVIPIRHWLTQFDVEPAKLFALNKDDESREVILLAWAESLLAFPEAEPAQAFASYIAAQTNWPKLAPAKSEVLIRILRGLADSDAAEIMESISGTGDLYWDLMFRTRYPIPRVYARATADRILNLLRAPSTTLYAPQARELALRVPASESARIVRFLSELPTLTAALEEFLRTLEFRHNYIAAFSSSPTSL
jgi:hypothetical protein